MASHATNHITAPTSGPVSWLNRMGIGPGRIGLVTLVVIAAPCFITLPWSLSRYDVQRLDGDLALAAPTLTDPMGTDLLGRSLLWRCLLGGTVSLCIGICAAGIAVVIGVCWGAVAGYAGGWVDAAMMRVVDVLYGLPYILLVVLLNIALEPTIETVIRYAVGHQTGSAVAGVITLLIAIGGISWLTMARVIRGQVLSLKTQPFIEAARACGAGPAWVLRRHMLPNLAGPVIVYTTLTVPTAILQESLLSFLGIGVQAPVPSWGNLATEGLNELHGLGQTGISVRWWLIVWPCTLLGLVLLSMNLLGDALRDYLDPKQAR